MAAGANNGMQAFLTALVNELTEPKVANFLKGMGLRLSAENLLPAGSWPKGSNVMDEMMEGTLLSVLSELPAPVTFSTYDTGTNTTPVPRRTGSSCTAWPSPSTS